MHYTRAHLTDRLEESLRRLRTDYVDLYLLHHRDPDTPPAAIAEVMQDLTQAGKIRYWGVSNHTAAEVANFFDVAPIAGVEDYYNIAGSNCDESGRSRATIYEEEMIPLLKRAGLGCMAFSPMDTGLLAPQIPDAPALADLAAAISRVFDLSPGGIIDALDLRRPIFSQTAAYGHFGREGAAFTWEQTPHLEALEAAVRTEAHR